MFKIDVVQIVEDASEIFRFLIELKFPDTEISVALVIAVVLLIIGGFKLFVARLTQ